MCVPARGSTCAEAGSERSWTVKRFSVAGVLGTLGEGGLLGMGGRCSVEYEADSEGSARSCQGIRTSF